MTVVHEEYPYFICYQCKIWVYFGIISGWLRGEDGLAALLGQALDDGADELAHLGVVVVEEGASRTVGDDEADGQRLMAQQMAEAVDGRGLHFEVGHRQVVVGEGGEPFVEVADGGVQADGASLGAVEAGGGGGDAVVHVGGYLVEQQWASLYAVGVRQAVIKLHVAVEGLFHLGQRGVPLAVVVHQPVEANGVGGGHVAAAVDVGLQRAAGADADDLK